MNEEEYMENMTEKFAEFCEQLKYEDLSPEVIKRTKNNQ